jgi:hypothetical protein
MIPAIIAQVDDGDRFYQLVQQQRYAEAIPIGERYLSTHPDNDAFAVDLAYALLDVGRAKEARRILTGRDKYFRDHPQAASIWRDIDAAEWKGPRFESYSSTQFEGRFGDQFFNVDQTYALAPPGIVQPYVAMHLAEDLRSGAPGSPQIFSDNALVIDAGVRRRLGPDLVSFIEGGAGIGLRGQGTIGDVRYGLAYSRQWASAPLPSTTVNLSAAIYSRYAGNGITYYNVLHSFGGRYFRPIAVLNGGFDSHNVFGNRFVEAEAGIETGNSKLSLRVLGVRGYYLSHAAGTASAPYTTLRVQMVFGASK